ncbi:MAG: hypothetical protein IKX88_08910 [Thermoguttaceae bacterium]|nr:hypothetical protein [Thermoguttaceae bacterium]
MNKVKECVEKASSSTDVNDLRVRFLGKSGEYTGLLRGLKDVPPAERGTIGKLINDGKIRLENMLAEKEAAFRAKEEERKLKAEKIDVTLSKGYKIGSTHPITKVKTKFWIPLSVSVSRSRKDRRSRRIITTSKPSAFPPTILRGICRTPSISVRTSF